MTSKGLWKHYNVKENKVDRDLSSCPRCGPGFFLANHADRLTCGKCGYTKFKT